MQFEVLHRDGAARCGRLVTPHGSIETPAFMPVGTLGAVKGLGPSSLEDLGAQVMLSNLYHLEVRPGVEAVRELGGLHRFTGWSGPILTDSGGFQVFSLSDLRTVDDDGVSFRSHVDGDAMRFTPEKVVKLQARLGVDIAMMLDECPPWPVDQATAAASWRRTLDWARRAKEALPAARREGLDGQWRGALFGIVQGSVFPALRERAGRELAELDLQGYAIGGVSVGEPDADRRKVVEVTAPVLPEDRPRYLMGVGYPEDLLHAVSQGVDLFDCVLPARNARHGNLFTRQGVVKLKNARFGRDDRPVDEHCRCPTCSTVSRAFLHHLFRCREFTAGVLATQHNLFFYLSLMADLRAAIAAGELASFSASRAGTA